MLDTIKKNLYIIKYRDTTAGVFLNNSRREIESLLERITVPRCYEDLPVRSNKDFLFNYNMKKAWKEIAGFEGLYKVSNFGEIVSTGKGSNPNFRNQYTDKGDRYKKLTKDRDGYLHVSLYLHTKIHTFLVSRLVMREFIGESNLEVNHIDGNKENNRLDNLEYCTRLENEKHAWRIGLKDNNSFKSKFVPVNQYDLELNFIKRYNSESIASIETGTKIGDISACLCGKQHTANGFYWHRAKKL